MAIFKRASYQALVLAGLMLAGCAEGGDGIFTTGSLSGQPTAEQKVDPACVTLASRIEALRKEGIPDKIEKAASRRYKMTQADLGKADQLTKANAEFQGRCSTVPPSKTTTTRRRAGTEARRRGRRTTTRRQTTFRPCVI